MTGQVIFKIDKRLKEQALKKAHAEGFPFASILKLATKAFVEGKLKIDIVEAMPFNAKTAGQMKKILKDIEDGKNLSPSFSSAQEAFKYLKG